MWRVGWIYQKFDCALKPSGQEKYSHPRKQHSWHPLKGHCVRKQPKSKKSLETYFPSLFWNYCSTRQGKGVIPNKRLVSRWEKRAQEIVSPPRKSGYSFLLVPLWIRCTHAQSHAVGKPWWWEGKEVSASRCPFPKKQDLLISSNTHAIRLWKQICMQLGYWCPSPLLREIWQENWAPEMEAN